MSQTPAGAWLALGQFSACERELVSEAWEHAYASWTLPLPGQGLLEVWSERCPAQNPLELQACFGQAETVLGRGLGLALAQRLPEVPEICRRW